MKIAISNIAWDPHEEQDILKLMYEYGIGGIEIAPTKVWEKPAEQSKSDISKYRLAWIERKIEIVGMQSLLYNQPQLQLFSDENSRNELKKYLGKIIEAASALGARAMVFGSPKNRIVGELPYSQAWEIAVDFFAEIGEKASAYDVLLCIEPNPKAYQCDFITTAKEGLQLVKDVNNKGFQLHLDSAAMILNEEDIEKEIENCMPYLAHFHISEPYLGVIGKSGNQHIRIAEALQTLGYQHWTSIEMRNGLKDSNAETVKEAFNFVSKLYVN